MGVKIREKMKGSGDWWIFIDHRGNRVAKHCGDLATAEEAQRIIERQLALNMYQFPKREPKKSQKPIVTVSEY